MKKDISVEKWIWEITQFVSGRLGIRIVMTLERNQLASLYKRFLLLLGELVEERKDEKTTEAV